MEELKLLAVGDLHGKSCWQEINFDQYDRVIFLGDYVDGENHSDQEILDNLYAVIGLKKSLPDKIILILGNHDIHYLHYPKYSCSGFRTSMQEPLTAIFNKNKHLFQVSYQIQNHLFSHAGISAPWFKDFESFLASSPIDEQLTDFETLADTFNSIESTEQRDILHQVGVLRGGPNEYGGITWADKEEVWNHPLQGYHQVVGHTPVLFMEAISYDDDTSVTFVDVLGSQEAYYEISI